MATSGLKKLDCVVGALVLIGALNWGLVGLFRIDLVGSIFGEMTILSRMVYVLVGFAALYDILFLRSIWRRWHIHFHEQVHA